MRGASPENGHQWLKRTTWWLAPIDSSVLDRAVQVAELLARTGRHRGARPVDLVIAAAAETARVSVLHYDSDYDRIAAVTNQATEWIAPAGTLD